MAHVNQAVNASLTIMYWQIGMRINQEVLQGERAEYGKQVVANLAQQLTNEFGKGFSFIAQQKRIQLDGDVFYIDLLFFNRKLKRLIAIDLKLGKFKPQYKGQMELYLRWLDKYERQADEQPPLGIILCAEKNQEQIELLQMDNSGIHVAEYLTVLPDRDLLHNRLQKAITNAQNKYKQLKYYRGIFYKYNFNTIPLRGVSIVERHSSPQPKVGKFLFTR